MTSEVSGINHFSRSKIYGKNFGSDKTKMSVHLFQYKGDSTPELYSFGVIPTIYTCNATMLVVDLPSTASTQLKPVFVQLEHARYGKSPVVAVARMIAGPTTAPSVTASTIDLESQIRTITVAGSNFGAVTSNAKAYITVAVSITVSCSASVTVSVK